MENNGTRVLFTEDMKRDYTILIPTMLPRHFKIISGALSAFGYKSEILEDSGKPVVERGQQYVHNDACYPSILVIGQFIAALDSGRYDPHKVALMLAQTGGGCRASNYVSLLRKALERAGYEYVPIISLNFSGLEQSSGFKLTLPLLRDMLYSVLYGDLIMSLVNQCKPYELHPGDSEALAEYWTARLAQEFRGKLMTYRRIKRNYREMLRNFEAIPRFGKPKAKVGIVGEIFVKFSPLGNNNLEEFLINEGAEIVMPGLLDFCMYCVYNGIMDTKLYGINRAQYPLWKLADRFLLKKQRDLIQCIKKTSFTPPLPFDKTRTLAEGYVGIGAKMGEGWLLTAEMLELIHEGAPNIVCTQPFGCLPNHIVGKGVMKLIRERHPEANIVAIDYDPGATRINQENRIKLMLANASSRSGQDKPFILRPPKPAVREKQAQPRHKKAREAEQASKAAN